MPDDIHGKKLHGRFGSIFVNISVVIPTYNRAADLTRCLAALKAQTAPVDSFEVIVIDDGSTDGTPEVLAQWAADWPVLRYYRQSNAGPATARNQGISRAHFGIIAFTDDDCLPAPDWVQRIQERMSAGIHGCLHGPIRSSLPSSTFVHSVIADGAVITSNIAFEKAVFERVGVFDTAFPAPWCEDADMCYRMRKLGVTITYDPALLVDHPPRYQGFWNFLKKTRFFQYYGLMARKHPDMEPLSRHADRLQFAAKKLAILVLASAAIAEMFSIPVSVAAALSPVCFWFVDGYRLAQMKGDLARNGIHVALKDQLLFVLFNWTSNLAESYFLLKGAIRYGAYGGRQ
jgi:glycosyltransferase involved in cell wall biosynthesis